AYYFTGAESLPVVCKAGRGYETEDMLYYEEAALEEKIDGLSGFQKEFVEEPTDAYIADYVPGNGFELVGENPGNRLNRNKTIEVIRAAVDGLEEQVNLEAAGCYEEPKVTAEDKGLQETYAKLQNYVTAVITYSFGTEREILDGDTVADWITREGNQVTLDPELVKEYVNSLRKKHDTVFHKRQFLTSYGEEVTIEQGDYGWWMDVAQETEELIGLLERGESGERVPVYRQTAASYDSPDYGDSYVEINLTAQHLFLYQNGECVLESDFVSGNSSRGNDTPAGIYGITYKERNATLNGENYSTPVSFWMPFNNNVGMHDATWRSEFGGNIYLTNGSHGCINLPYTIAQEIYEYVEKDTPVICYHLPGTEPEPLPEIPLELEPGMGAPEDGLTAPGTEETL
ncbi:MAG: L,D-transpeptidase/peptidoglycan binding protein, partial [Lachnospiraceae bacterium]|nr:L,D-transpeptidase/peptidoglycan binding protein [Lachnospiraceae bacterium]